MERRRVGAPLAVHVFAAYMGLATAMAEDKAQVATVTQPALVLAKRSGRGASLSEHIVVRVIGFRPAQEGAVQVVVKAVVNGAKQEVGRFGIFPNAPFKSEAQEQAQMFSLTLPKELANVETLALQFSIQPFRGTGTGAEVEIGGAEIE
jgi:hypothetical protein